jgi:hypothetical protein
MGEMKAKFDKIMSNFLEDTNHPTHKPKPQYQTSDDTSASGILEFKNKNLQNNV